MEAMEWRERLVETSRVAVNAAAEGNLAEAYRCALVMISLINEIDFHEDTSLDLSAITDRVLSTDLHF
jgi:hypothetical protein